jgi:RNA polymerase sigma factor (sigma-70 family)
MSEDDRRFDELYRRFYDRLVKDLRREGYPDDYARQHAHDALMDVLDEIDAIPGDAQWAYVRTTARRLKSNVRRRENTLRRGGSNLHVSLEVVDVTASKAESAEERLIREEQTARFHRAFAAALDELAVETKHCLILKRRGLGSKEIARHLGMTDEAVRSRLKRAFQHLRDRLGSPPAGIALADLAGDNDHDHE